MDPRQRRSRERLTRAVLTLAAAQRVDTIAVSELASIAGVNRSTFYEHAVSPIGLLRDVLRSELDDVRHEHLGSATDHDGEGRALAGGDAIRRLTRGVLEHVDGHAEIYRRGLGDDSAGASLHSMLSDQFRETIRIILAGGSVTLPTPGPVAAEVATAFLADGAVGAIAVWVNGPEPRDLDDFLEVFGRTLPHWWPWTEVPQSSTSPST